MAGGELGEAALGAVVGELLRAVLRAQDRVVRFKSILLQLQSTLESIVPIINEIDRLNQELDDSQNGDIVKLRVALKNAQKLLNKCEDVACWNCWSKNRYAKKLQELDDTLLRLCQINLQVVQLKDIKLILAELAKLKVMYQKLLSLDRKKKNVVVRTLLKWRVLRRIICILNLSREMRPRMREGVKGS